MTEKIIKIAVRNKLYELEFTKLYLPLTLPLTAQCVMTDSLGTAAGNTENGLEIMALLIEHSGIGFQVTDNVLKQAT